jgi:hypothetical protein
LCFGREFLESKVVSIEYSLESLTKQKRVLAIAQSEAHFVEAGLQVLCAEELTNYLLARADFDDTKPSTAVRESTTATGR